MEMSNLPLIVDIKRHSLVDGPGIRSVVFFKGCSLRCIFCHNPECQDPRQEIAFYPGTCIHCDECVETCESEAIDNQAGGRIIREKCNMCGKCVDACPTSSIRLIGKRRSVDDIFEELLCDQSFYRHSGGGVTLSGGECTLWPDFLEPLLIKLKEKEIHLLLETSGYFNFESFRRKILPYLDVVYFDLKLIDDNDHMRITGKSNARILDNFQRFIKLQRVEVLPRTPIIPGITDTKKNLTAIVDFLCDAGAEKMSLLPYNPMWIDTALNIGRPKPSLPESFMKPDEEKAVYLMLRNIIAEKEKKTLLAPVDHSH
ncbi:glycyl-radical enzyme activating protein [Thermodesulfobacteriota bacterium]